MLFLFFSGPVGCTKEAGESIRLRQLIFSSLLFSTSGTICQHIPSFPPILPSSFSVCFLVFSLLMLRETGSVAFTETGRTGGEKSYMAGERKNSPCELTLFFLPLFIFSPQLSCLMNNLPSFTVVCSTFFCSPYLPPSSPLYFYSLEHRSVQEPRMCEKESVEKGKGCMYRMCTSVMERG